MSLIICKKNVPMSGVNPIKSLRLSMDSDDIYSDAVTFSISLKFDIKSDESKNDSEEQNEKGKENDQYIPNRKYDFYTHEVANSFYKLTEVETDGGWDPNWDEKIEETSADEENSINEETTNDGVDWNDEFADDDDPEEMSDEDLGDGFAPFFKNEREALEIWGISEKYEQC